jgi:hypothetical protein
MENIIPIIELIGFFILVYLIVHFGFPYIYSKIKKLLGLTSNPPEAKVREKMGFFDSPPWATGCLWVGVFFLGIFAAVTFTVGLIQGCQLNLFVLVLVALPWAGLILAWTRPGIGGLLLISPMIAFFALDAAGLLSEKSPDVVNTYSSAAWSALGFIPVSLVLFYLEWDRRKKQKRE